MITLYGIPNCDTVKKARSWLSENGLAYTFHDFKKQGVPSADLEEWLKTLGWESVLNRKGTTWRKLDEEQRAGVTDASSAQSLLLENASAIKRPVVRWADGSLTVGFDAAAWAGRI